MPSVTVIAEAADAKFSKRYTNDQELTEDTRIISENRDAMVNYETQEANPGRSHSSAFAAFPLAESTDYTDNSQVVKGSTVYPPFPCPFCDRAYTSWGFRRRHIKAVHAISPRLNCKWCPQVNISFFLKFLYP